MNDDVDDAAIEALMLALVGARRDGASICPSEVARGLDRPDWRALMPQVRAVARVLALRGEVEVTQRGALLDAAGDWRGAIRIRRAGSALVDRRRRPT
jgi:hypothetical protein